MAQRRLERNVKFQKVHIKEKKKNREIPGAKNNTNKDTQVDVRHVRLQYHRIEVQTYRTSYMS